MQSKDIVVIGGGMVGLSAALALANLGLSVTVVDGEWGDQALSKAPQLRVSAISLSSQHFLQHLEVWQNIAAQRLCAYTHMKVWEQDSFASISFDHHSVQQPHLGHIIENQLIRQQLWQQAEQHASINLIAPAKIAKLVMGQSEVFVELNSGAMLTTKLVVGADGANSFVRQQQSMPQTFWDYGHRAIVATIKTVEAHQNTARQVFTPAGPLAFLPLWQDDLCSIVWSQTSERAEHLMAMEDTDFNRTLTTTFDNQLGMCELQSQRVSFPLKMSYSRQWVKDRTVLIGDAAHTIHPLAGQGANLGFMDAAALAQVIDEGLKAGKDIADIAQLRQYERWRKSEAIKMIAVMEGFKRLFSGSHPVKKLIRDIGLSAADNLPFAKPQLIRQALGLEGELPKSAKLITR